MKKYTPLISALLILYSFTYSAFGASREELSDEPGPIEKVETLRQMQENIKTLEQEKQRLQFKWNTFRIGNETLGDLIQQDILEEEKKTLESIIILYGTDSQKVENKISSLIERGKDIKNKKKELLLLKQSFYKSLIPYIQKDKLPLFLKYIDSDLNLREKSKDVSLKIEQKNIKREERIEEIQDKIEDNSKVLREQIHKKITVRVKEKLDSFISKKEFDSLSNETKIKIFRKLILKLKEKKKTLKNTINTNSLLEEKIILFETVEEILSEYLEKWE